MPEREEEFLFHFSIILDDVLCTHPLYTRDELYQEMARLFQFNVDDSLRRLVDVCLEASNQG